MSGPIQKKNPQLSQTSVSLDTYQKLVDRCALERLNYPIANGSAVHARILIDKLFDIAERDVCLVTGSLRQAGREGAQIYSHENVIASAQRFLAKPGSSLSIILQSGKLDGGNTNKFLCDVIGSQSRTGTVIILMPKPEVLSHNETPHFMVTDRTAYRFETGKDADPNNEAISAVANFGDEKSAKILAEIFGTAAALVEADDNLLKKMTFVPGEKFAA
jgi:hypothetical protein